jgi:F-type H+-transporting ATPase subunit epsilon
MSTFHLQIVTPDGMSFEGQAESLSVRTQDGGVTILPGHIDYMAPLGMGPAKVKVDEKKEKERVAACIGGMVAVTKGDVRLVATTFEWADEIDVDRAQRSEEKARKVLDDRDRRSDKDIKLAEARLKRSLVRQGVASRKYF